MRLRTLITSTVAAAAVTVPLVATAAPSNAATLRTWNRLAQCESGGRWHINTGNGYYGGLQISASTWRAYGGRHYAYLPNRATKAHQIRVAERIRAGQGWGAWPTCSARLGLR
ncbi:MAG: transglycosylase family protein [Nocardioides sp.]|nr:transglycosylase family protein [Nocardioides sp.]